MKIGVVINSSEVKYWAGKLQSRLDSEICLLEYDAKKKGSFLEKLETYKPDVCLTFNLAGFELGTLAGNLMYNLLACKQLHIITDASCTGQAVLTEPVGIQMFFVFADKGIKELFERKYPLLPRTTLLQVPVCEEEITKLAHRVYTIKGDEEL